MTMSAKIRRYLAKGTSIAEIAKRLGVSKNNVWTVIWKEKQKAKVAKPEAKPEEKRKPGRPKKEKAVEIKKDPKAEAWKKRNAWFGFDESKTIAALAYHEKLLSDGIDPKSDEYWDKVNAKFGKFEITRKELLNEINPGLDALFGLDYKQHATAPDPVNHPPHYKAGGIEVIDFIEAKDLNFRLANVVKYVSRAGKKNSDPVQDLEKAAWYLKREIDARKGA